MSDDAYEICRKVRRYHEKNGYPPKRTELGCSPEFFEQLVQNGVVEVLPLYEGGSPVNVVLSEKGLRMSERRR